MILAAFALFAIWLDPADPAKYVATTYSLLAGYFCYSIVLALAVWRTNFCWSHSVVVIHAFDLLIFAVLISLTSGPSSPFFAFFVFSIVSATLRWHWRGTLYTAVIAFGVATAMVAYQTYHLQGPQVHINLFTFRIGYLLVIGILLGYLGFYEQQLRGKIASLAAWPRTIPEEFNPLVSETLQLAASLLAVPRTLLFWKEEEEPLIHAASWSGEEFHHSLESPDTFGALVAEPLANENFLCRDLLAPKPSVLKSLPTGFERWEGMPLNTELQRRFSIKSVLSLALQSENVTGRLFALDNERMTSDDLVLGGIISRDVSCNLDQFFQRNQLRQTAATEVRIRLCRDLHDGLLQSLTGAALQLETARRLMEKDPQTARQRITDIEKLIYAEQQDLRSQIRQLKPPYSSLSESDGDLAGRLKELAERIERQWGPRVELDVKLNPNPLTRAVAHEVYFIVHEAMINAARHAKASSIHAQIISEPNSLRIVVADNGCGFSFRGRHDQSALARMNLGPITLRERVASLGGSLTIESGDTGACLEIALPIMEKRG